MAWNSSSNPSRSVDSAAAATSPKRLSDCLIFAPTYNECNNIDTLLDALLGIEPRCDVLIVDDSSTDGTTDLLQCRAAAEPRLCVIVRAGKFGIGSAHKLGWLYARRAGYARIVTLDADLSHNPADVPRLLAELDDGAEVAIGSRFMPGGGLDYRGWRLFVSRYANRAAQRLLRLPLAEYTTSLRAARLDRVPAGLVEAIENDGYGFFLTCAVGFARTGLKIVEIPIQFRDRSEGVSKIPRLEIVRGAVNLARLFLRPRRKPTPVSLTAIGDECPACHEPYHVTMASGAGRCFVCRARKPDDRA